MNTERRNGELEGAAAGAQGKKTREKSASFLRRHTPKLAWVAIAAVGPSIASITANNTIRHEDESVACPAVDESLVDNYAQQIEEIYDRKAPSLEEQEQLVKKMMQSHGPNVLHITTPEREPADTISREIIGDLATLIPTQYIEASGIKHIEIDNLSRGVQADRRAVYSINGSYKLKNPDTVFVDSQHSLEDPYDEVAMTLRHEIGHAAMIKLCGGYYPPKQYTDSNPKDFQYGDSSNVGDVEVSRYAEVDSGEAIVEMMAVLTGAQSSEAKAKLHKRLAADDPVAERKTAVAAAMLEKLSPGLGDIAMLYLHFE